MIFILLFRVQFCARFAQSVPIVRTGVWSINIIITIYVIPLGNRTGTFYLKCESLRWLLVTSIGRNVQYGNLKSKR